MERLVLALDGDLPGGARWHRDLLARAAGAVELGRSALLTWETAEDLGQLASFRHRFRNAYLRFDYERARPNVALAARCVPTAAFEIEEFCGREGIKPAALPRRFPPPA